MTPDEFETCYVPVPIRQRYITAGDVLVLGELWQVRGARPGWMDAAYGHRFHAADVDPDQVFEVLTPVPMAQAVALTREQIGMQLIGRRTEEEVA